MMLMTMMLRKMRMTMKMYLWATCSSSPTQSLEEKDEIFVKGIFGNHILIDTFKEPKESSKGDFVKFNSNWIRCKPVARVFWYAGHHGHSSHASVPEMKCQENTFWSKIKSQLLRLASNCNTLKSYQNSKLELIFIIIVINDHLGKPMDALLRGGRSKRSKDFDLDATLRLRCACNRFNTMIFGTFWWEPKQWCYLADNLLRCLFFHLQFDKSSARATRLLVKTFLFCWGGKS